MVNKKEGLDKIKDGETYSDVITLNLDTYQDLFSDFDAREYRQKSVSDDFLIECKRACKDKGEKIELKLFVPKIKRNLSNETNIKKRLKEHFQRHLKEQEKSINKIKKAGLLWFFAGAVILTLNGIIFQREEALLKFLSTILEPASWFFFWEGLGKMFIESRKGIPDYEFNKKMSHATIRFLDR
ncbi:MAG: hypothetical protein WCX73_03975 [Candidatus Pacearchaeota archaeon]|jgi:hypothetical protein